VTVGASDLRVKFSRSAVQAALTAGGEVAVTVGGDIGDSCFTGGDVARVIHATVTSPDSGTVVAYGQTTLVRWDSPSQLGTHWADVYLSTDDGTTWNRVATHLTDSGAWEWHPPYANAGNARRAV